LKTVQLSLLLLYLAPIGKEKEGGRFGANDFKAS
jgi:hypothetical protein